MINIKDLDIYDQIRINEIQKLIGLELENTISQDQLLRLIEIIFNEYVKTRNDYMKLADEYQELVNNIYG